MARKICIFCSHYFPYLGGVERYTYHLARALMEQGDKVVIVTSNDMHLETFSYMEGIPVFPDAVFQHAGRQISGVKSPTGRSGRFTGG